MATRTISNAGGNWSATAAWVEGAVPTAADDVVATGTSGNLTIDAASVCRSLNLTGYTGVLTHNAFTLSIGDATAGAGNVALKLVAGMTYTLANVATSAITFVSTSATQQTVDVGGKATGNLTFNGIGGNWALTSALSMDVSATLTSTAGDLHFDGTSDAAGLTHVLSRFTGTSSTLRTINAGHATFTMATPTTTATYWNMSNSANVTFLGSSATWNVTSNTSGVTESFNTGDKIYGTVVLTGPSEMSFNPSGTGKTATVANLTRNGSASTISNQLSLPLGGSGTTRVTSSLTLTGVDATKRLVVWPNNNALPTTLDVTGATVTGQYVNFQDVQAVGMPDLSAISGGSGDCGGNTGITFTAAVTQHWSLNTGGNWSDPTKWTSRIPLPHDPIVIDAAFTGSPTINCDMAFAGGNFDATGGSGAVTLNSALTNGGNIVGSITWRSGITWANSASCTWYFNSRKATDTLNGNGSGNVVGSNVQVSSGNGGNFNVVGDTKFAGSFQHRSGTITVAAGKLLTLNSYQSNASNAPAICRITGPGQWALAGTGTIFSELNAATLTTIDIAETLITSTSATSKTFAGNGGAFNTQLVLSGGTGQIIFTGANTFSELPRMAAGGVLTFPAGSTTTFAGGDSFRNGSNVVTIQSSTGGTAATLSKPNGKVRADFLSVKDVTATGAGFSAGANSTNVSGNTGVTFTAPAADDHLLFAAAA